MADAITQADLNVPIPVCPVRGSVLYPTMVMPIDAGRPVSIRAINGALEPVIQSCIIADEEARLAAVGNDS